jgi:aspartate kinase
MKNMDKTEIGGILHRTDLAEISLMSIPNRPGVAGEVLEALGHRRISVRLIVQCIDPQQHTHILLCIVQEDLESALSAVEDIRSKVGAGEVTHRPQVAMISIFGPEFQERPGLAGAMFSALASAGIDIWAISTSIATVSCLIDVGRIEEAIEALHNTFEVSTEWQI